MLIRRTAVCPWASLLAFALLLPPVCAGATGSWEISGDGTVFSFSARDASAADIIRGLEDMTGVSLNVKKLPDRPVTVKYINVTLDELMYRMGLEYVLEYTRAPDSGEFELSSGWINYGDPADRLYRDFVVVNPDQDAAGEAVNAGQGGGFAFPPGVREKLLIDREAPGSTYRAAFPVTPGRLDGRIDNWPEGTPWQEVGADASIGVTPPTNNLDASFSMAGLADGTNMYLAVAIRDDMKAVTNASRVTQTDDDSIRLLLNGAGTGDRVSLVINRHHVYRERVEGDASPRAAPVQYVSYNSGVKAVIRDGEEGWNLEIAVPLDPLGIDAADGSVVGFDVQLNDVDAGEANPHVLGWSSAAQLNQPFSGLGSFEFIDIRE